MQTVTPAFVAAATSYLRKPVFEFRVWWSGVNGGTSDESGNVLNWATNFAIGKPAVDLRGTPPVGLMTVTLDNKAFRYSWLKDEGVYDPETNDNSLRVAGEWGCINGAGGLRGKKVQMKVGFEIPGDEPELVYAFVGIIADWNENSKQGTVELNCLTFAEEVYQHRLSTGVNGAATTPDSATLTNIDALPMTPSQWINWLCDGYMAGSVPENKRLLDPSYTKTPYVWMDDETPLEEMQESATSEGGIFWFDSQSRIVYRNHAFWVNPSYYTAPRHAFVADDMDNIVPSWSADALATKIVVEWNTREAGKVGVVYEMDQSRVIAPGETITFTARFGQPAIRVNVPVAEEDYWFVTPGGVTLNGNLEDDLPICQITIELYAQSAKVTVTNRGTMMAVMTWFQIRGTPVVGGLQQQDEFIVNADNPPVPYERVRSVRDTAYVQTPTQVALLGAILKDRVGSVSPVFTIQNVPALPHLEIGDRVSYTDGRTMPVRYGYIFGIRTDYGADLGLVQTITVVDDAVMTTPPIDKSYFIIGTSALDGTQVAYY